MPRPEPWLAIEDPAEPSGSVSRTSSDGIGRTSGCYAASCTTSIPRPQRPRSRTRSRSGWAICSVRSRPLVQAGGELGSTLSAALSLAMSFETWATLTGAGLSDEQAVRWLVTILQTAADD